MRIAPQMEGAHLFSPRSTIADRSSPRGRHAASAPMDAALPLKVGLGLASASHDHAASERTAFAGNHVFAEHRRRREFALERAALAAERAAPRRPRADAMVRPAPSAGLHAVADGTDIEARAQMRAAAAMGATAFQKGLGAIHALSHPAGALYDTHHGLTNAVFMPYVLVYNRQAIETKIERLDLSGNKIGPAGAVALEADCTFYSSEL